MYPIVGTGSNGEAALREGMAVVVARRNYPGKPILPEAAGKFSYLVRALNIHIVVHVDGFSMNLSPN